MPKNRSIRKSPSRVLLSDVLPYEMSPMFSNRGFYEFAISTKLRFANKQIFAERMSALTEPLVSIILGESASHGNSPLDPLVATTGQPIQPMTPTIPFRFTVRHKRNEYRTLAVPHPRAQLDITAFYEKYSTLIVHYSGMSSFSLRHASRIARYSVTKDWLFERLRGGDDNVEEATAEYDWIRSYFTYQRYSNIYKFYDSREYRSAERRFGYLLRVDVAKCFDSIYTHSIAWATHGHDPVKNNIPGRPTGSVTGSFGDNFDKLMQRLNHNETSGITIGSETSRIFAEIILQRIDRHIEDELHLEKLRFGIDYEILRYVDDYFVFVANQENEAPIVEAIARHLRKYKLHLNAAKEEGGATPWLSPLTVAKRRVRELLRTGLRIDEFDTDDSKLSRYWASGHSFAVEYKAILIDTQVSHLEIANYALSQVERSLERLLRDSLEKVDSQGQVTSAEKRAHFDSVVAASISLIDLAFLIFSGAPRLSPSVKVARITAICIEYVRSRSMPTYLREQLEFRIRTELIQQLRRARSAASPDTVTATLLDCITNLGPAFRIPEAELADLFGFIHIQDAFAPAKGMNANLLFSLLAHIGNANGYQKLRRSCEEWVVSVQDRPTQDGERAIISANIVLCPFVSHSTRLFVMRAHGYESARLTNELLQSGIVMNINWRKFDLYRALHKKRLYDVY